MTQTTLETLRSAYFALCESRADALCRHQNDTPEMTRLLDAVDALVTDPTILVCDHPEGADGNGRCPVCYTGIYDWAELPPIDDATRAADEDANARDEHAYAERDAIIGADFTGDTPRFVTRHEDTGDELHTTKPAWADRARATGQTMWTAEDGWADR